MHPAGLSYGDEERVCHWLLGMYRTRGNWNCRLASLLDERRLRQVDNSIYFIRLIKRNFVKCFYAPNSILIWFLLYLIRYRRTVYRVNRAELGVHAFAIIVLMRMNSDTIWTELFASFRFRIWSNFPAFSNSVILIWFGKHCLALILILIEGYRNFVFVHLCSLFRVKLP